MIVPVCLLFTLFSLLFLFTSENSIRRSKKVCVILLFTWVGLSLIAAFRPDMADKENYELFFQYPIYGKRFEIGFRYLTELIKRLGAGLTFFFFFFAAISIALKLWAIRKMTTLLWGSLAIYVSNFFILHDMIQMRCAVASGLLLHAVYFVWKRNLLAFLIVTSVAVLFHYSAVIIFPLWCLNTTKSQKFFYIGLIVIAYMLGGILSLVNYIQYIPIKGINELWSSYRSTIGGDINIYNGVTLLRVLLCLFLLISSERIYVRNKLVFLLTKIYSIAIAAFVLFANLPVVAWRVSELFMIIEIILLDSINHVI